MTATGQPCKGLRACGQRSSHWNRQACLLRGALTRPHARSGAHDRHSEAITDALTDACWLQASKGVFSALSCQAAVADEGEVASVDREQFSALICHHVSLHRDLPLSQEDLAIACRCTCRLCRAAPVLLLEMSTGVPVPCVGLHMTPPKWQHSSSHCLHLAGSCCLLAHWEPDGLLLKSAG